MTETATADSPAAVAAISPWPAALHRVAGWSLFFLIVIAALVAGLDLRRWAWDQTEPIRYVMDIDNAFRQGTETLMLSKSPSPGSTASWWVGYINRYDNQETKRDHELFMDLDYAPGRLLIATLWTRWVREKVDGPITDYQKLKLWPQQFYTRARQLNRQYELCRPLLMVNVIGEVLSTIAMFFLVRRYSAGKPPIVRPVRSTILGLIAALFFWFDPALICNAHCWPQWDSWVLPFFLWAILLASLDWWFCSGLLIAIGAMFKGQILFGAPIFLLWPLFQGRLPAVARWVVGLFTAVAVITAVWLVRIPGTNPTGKLYIPGSINVHAIEWVVYLGLVFLAMASMLRWPRHPQARIPVLLFLVAIVIWVIGAHTSHSFSIIGFVALAAAAVWLDQRGPRLTWQLQLPLVFLGLVILLWPVHVLADAWLSTVERGIIAVGVILAISPRRVLPYAFAGWISAALLLCIPIFGSSKGWFDLGFAYGTHHYERMGHGQLENLPELLQQQWGWDDLMAPAITLPAGGTADRIAAFLAQIDPGVKLVPGKPIDLPLKYFLVGLWLVVVVLCAIGAAIHDRNRSPRFLAAVAAPWIVFFAVMTQMHQRYLLWGASLSSVTAIFNPGYALLHLFLSVVSATQELESMMNNKFDATNHGQFTQLPFYQFIEQWHPGIAWAVLLTAGIFVYTAVKWERVRK